VSLFGLLLTALTTTHDLTNLPIVINMSAASKSAAGGIPTVPILKDLTIDNITDNVHRINSQCGDARLKYILERLVSHLHDFARETRLSFDEWMTGIKFLTEVGQTCTPVRQVRDPRKQKRSPLLPNPPPHSREQHLHAIYC